MKVVYRYGLRIADNCEVELPAGAEILKFAARDQHPDAVEFWALVDPEARTETHRWRVVGTGHPFPDSDEWRYLDSVITLGGSLVWHIFREETGQEFADRMGME